MLVLECEYYLEASFTANFLHVIGVWGKGPRIGHPPHLHCEDRNGGEAHEPPPFSHNWVLGGAAALAGNYSNGHGRPGWKAMSLNNVEHPSR